MAEGQEWQKGMPTHENIIFSCFGGLSNTGISNTQASFISGAEIKRAKGLIIKAILED